MITLKTLPDATAQEVFDQCAGHLLRQMKQSSDTDGMCRYQSSEWVLQCAAGCFIADDEYKFKWEGKIWSDLVEKGSVPSAHRELISELQNIHDQILPRYWRSQLKKLATKRGLKFNSDKYR